MIRFHLSFCGWWRNERFANKWTWHKKITANKTFDIQFYRHYYNWYEIEIDTRWRGHDHAGPKIELGIMGQYVRLALVDRRHWDWTNNTWCEPEDSNETTHG